MQSFFSSRRRHTRWTGDWSSDVCSSDLGGPHFAVGIGVGGGVGANVGWFPLGPREVYVPSYHVSRTYVNNVNISNTTVNQRSEERRVGKECRSRRWHDDEKQYHQKPAVR